MDEPMTHTRLLDLLSAARAEWEAALALLDDARMTNPAAGGGWSVKDIIAHIAWHEREIAPVFRTRVFSGSDLWALPLDERNRAIFDHYRDRALDETLRDEWQAYAALWEALQPLSDADLLDPTRYQNMPVEWLPWRLVAENSYEHYAAHLSDIRSWLAARGA
jgi:hypothetical protein